MATYQPKLDADGHRMMDGSQVKYLVRWYERAADGSWKPRKRTVSGERAAKALAADMEAKHQGEAGTLPDAGSETVADQIVWFLDRYKKAPRKRGKTVEDTSYEAAERELLLLGDVLGETTPWADVTPRQLADAIDARRDLRTGEPVAAGTRNRMRAVIQAMCTDLHVHGRDTANRGADLPHHSDGPATADDDRVTIPTWEQLQALADDLDRRTTPVRTRWGGTTERARWQHIHDDELWFPSDRMWLFVCSGFSFSEAAGARIVDWERDDHWLVLRKTLPRRADELRDHGKTDARMVDRRVPVPDRFVPVLDRLASYSWCGLLLTGPDGQRLAYETWRNQLSQSAEATGVHITTHGLRHVAASMWIDAAVAAGQDWEWPVMKFGGWSSLDQVQRTYGHLTDHRVQEGKKAMDALLEAM